MGLFHSDKAICLRLRVSFENQRILCDHIDAPYAPLFQIKQNQFYNIRFEYKDFTCTFQSKKQKFTYEDIQKIATIHNGLIIYLNNNLYLSIATENYERHNSELLDVVMFLKRHCRGVFVETEEILFPENEDSRYKSNQEPISQISFELSDKEIRHLLWYDYLISEKMLIQFIAIVIGALVSILLKNLWLAILTCTTIVLTLVLTIMFIKEKDRYAKNFQGILYLMMYDKVLVVRLHYTDIDLEYNTMKKLKNKCGMWRIKSGDFFILALPKRLENESSSFFNELYSKMH